ncbi:MAG: aldose 1-epimerase family protein [bacterium]|nr:aldose 1-epimerase family protein [bacterium]
MLSSIANKYAEIVVDDFGAELKSFKLLSRGIEFIWEANQKIWERHSPVLFPIVGKLKDNSYKFGDNLYSLNQHGFARDSRFKIRKKDKNLISYGLRYDKHTLNIFPFKFILEITYLLEKTSLKISFKTYNIDSRIMWFSIGAHPGFKCPFFPNEQFADYYIEFEKKEYAKRLFLKNGLLSGTDEIFLDNTNVFRLNPDIFQNDAIILKYLKSNFVSLKSCLSPHKITVELGNFPYMGLWMKPEYPLFICIEPWFGLADKYNCSGLLREKEGIISLNPGKSFECYYRIIIE